MVTTRSQSVSPRKRSTIYAELANMTPTPTSPKKRAASTASPTRSRSVSTVTATGSPTKKAPRRKSIVPKVMGDEIIVKREGDAEFVNGSAVEKRPALPRKASRSVSSGAKVKGKPAHKVDNSGKFEFGGTPGTLAMMTVFPVLMYYLWICSAFYGGSLQFRRPAETWLAFADRMVAH